MKNLFKSKIEMLLTKDKEVQAIVTGYDYVTNNMVAQVGNQRALIAHEDISIYQNKNADEEIHRLLGTVVHCNVIRKDKNDILLSRSDLMRKRIKSYNKGDIVEATIITAANNALYLEFDEGLIGKMYTNQITSAKVEKPIDLYNIGDKIKCTILKKQDDGRFILSRLSLYKSVNLNVECGNILKCKITQKVKEKEKPGYFVEVLSNPLYSGIFDINKYNYKNNYRVGDTINLRVVDIKDNNQLRFRTNLTT